ncbi:MAG: type VI secretion system tip protein VgrG [Nitrospirae bacterium]|nr:type VI secretion system tip protein VgrG [Nitrospirota bacterium]
MAIIRAKNEADYAFKAGSYTGDKLKVVRFYGNEGISELFHFSIDLASTDGEVDFEKVVGESALLTIHAEKGKRYVHGLVSLFEQIGKEGKWTLYRAEVVPAVWVLSRRITCRIFQNQSIPDIIKKALSDGGIASDQVRFSIKKSYKPRDYCVQYRESDFSFITRLMEQYGFFYFFEHAADKHVMVIGDDPVVHVPIVEPAKVIYRAPGTAGVSDQEHVYEYRYHREVRTGAVRLRDFDFKKPRLSLEQEAKAKGNGSASGGLEAYDYPGEYLVPDEGGDLAKVRLEELQATRQIGAGQSDCRRFVPGYRFTLEKYTRSDFNREYLLTRLSHSGSQPQVLGAEAAGRGGETAYQNQFDCIPSDVSFRPLRITPRPAVQGPQTAIVVGPKGEEIYTDEYSRVKVQFHWDRNGKQDEKSSCWIRVSQAWAGSGWGAIFIPRVGQEVIVEFLEGDPDRPIITGRVYNGDNKPPYALPGEKTKSTIKSNTSKGGGSANELLMEDNAGKTQVVLSNAYGHKITEDEESQSLTIETRDKNWVRLDDKNKNITVQTTNAHTIILDDQNKKMIFKTTDGHTIEMDDANKKILTQSKDGHVFLIDDQNKKIELTTVAGHSTILDDQNEKIGVTSKDGHAITIDDSGKSITLEDSGGAHKFKIDIGGSKLIVSTDSGAIDILAPSGKLTLKATEIDIEAQMDLKLKGMNVTSEAGVNNQVKGTMVTVEASAVNTIKGNPVMIN